MILFFFKLYFLFFWTCIFHSYSFFSFFFNILSLFLFFTNFDSNSFQILSFSSSWVLYYSVMFVHNTHAAWYLKCGIGATAMLMLMPISMLFSWLCVYCHNCNVDTHANISAVHFSSQSTWWVDQICFLQHQNRTWNTWDKDFECGTAQLI